MLSTEERRRARRFALEALLLLCATATWLWLRRHHPRPAIGFGAAGLTLGLLGLAWPRAALVVRRGWMAVGHAIGSVNGVVILTVIFFLVLTPVSALRFLLRRPRKSGWEPHEPRKPNHFDHPY